MSAVTGEPGSSSLAAWREALPRVRRALSFRRLSALYIFGALFLLFAVWVPETFLSSQTWRSLLDQQALTAMVAVALVIPLSAGAFDLAIGAEVGLGAIVAAWLIARQGLPVVQVVPLVLAAGALVGLISGLLVVLVKIDSFIATLGMSSILLAMVAWLSGSTQILDLGSGFEAIATRQLFGVTYPVYYMLVVALATWYVLEWTPAGRRLYATGGNAEAARLAGVRTSTVVLVAFVACGAVAAGAGMLVSARLATGDPTIGPSFLLPAFAAAFLGSTQFRGGRYNVWGTVLAVYVLATGVKGLQLAGAPVWIPELFNGAALILAVGLANFQAPAGRGSAIRRLIRRGGRG